MKATASSRISPAIKSSTRTMYVVMTFVAVVGAIFNLATGAGPNFVFLAAIGITMCIWSASARPVQLHRDHVRIRVAPLSRMKLIGYDQIEEIDERNPKKVLLRLGGGAKPVRLPMHLFTEQDGERLLDGIDAAVAA